MRRFNSKMVRLKVRRCNELDLLTEFQFQNGSIKSLSIPAICEEPNEFQFQNGSIKSPSNRHVLPLLYVRFQFQNGSIKRIF